MFPPKNNRLEYQPCRLTAVLLMVLTAARASSSIMSEACCHGPSPSYATSPQREPRRGSPQSVGSTVQPSQGSVAESSSPTAVVQTSQTRQSKNTLPCPAELMDARSDVTGRHVPRSHSDWRPTGRRTCSICFSTGRSCSAIRDPSSSATQRQLRSISSPPTHCCGT